MSGQIGEVHRDPIQAMQRALRLCLREVADPAKAAGMQRYMKSEMPYLGVQAPSMKKTCRELWTAHPVHSKQEWIDALLTLWREAEYREERYAAINLASDKRYSEYITLETVSYFEEMVVDGAWWDYVDAFASRIFNVLLKQHPSEMGILMRDWAVCADIWQRRTAIICQLKSKEETDVELLHDCIEPSIESSEFFLRKGNGWALREYAKTDPASVIEFVTSNADRLSRLSKREAVRNLIKDGLLDAVP